MRTQQFFRAARLPMVAQSSEIIASRILEVITTPLTANFLELSVEQEEGWSRMLLDEIRVLTNEQVPDTWVLHVHDKRTPSVVQRINHGGVCLGDLMRDPRQRDVPLEAKVLMLRRGPTRIVTPSLIHDCKSAINFLWQAQPLRAAECGAPCAISTRWNTA